MAATLTPEFGFSEARLAAEPTVVASGLFKGRVVSGDERDVAVVYVGDPRPTGRPAYFQLS